MRRCPENVLKPGTRPAQVDQGLTPFAVVVRLRRQSEMGASLIEVLLRGDICGVLCLHVDDGAVHGWHDHRWLGGNQGSAHYRPAQRREVKSESIGTAVVIIVTGLPGQPARASRSLSPAARL